MWPMPGRITPTPSQTPEFDFGSLSIQRRSSACLQYKPPCLGRVRKERQALLDSIVEVVSISSSRLLRHPLINHVAKLPRSLRIVAPKSQRRGAFQAGGSLEPAIEVIEA